MLPRVTGQLVRPCKLPAAAFVTAHVRLLASVRSLVGLQVAGLCVRLVTASLRASVDDLLPL